MEDAHALIHIGLAFEDWFALKHFPKDATNAPQVYGGRVPLQSEEQLWRTIPSSDYQTGVISHGFSVAFAGLRRLALVMARETEVGDLEQATVGDEDVGGFHVAV